MKSRLLYLSIHFLFWTVFFLLARIIFLVFHLDQTLELQAGEIFWINLLGLRMDLSMAGYFTLLPGLLLTCAVLFSIKKINQIISSITVFLILISTIIIVADLELYLHWRFRMDATPLLYLQPEALASTTNSRLFFLFLIGFLFSGSAIWFYFHFIRKFKPEDQSKAGYSIPVLIFTSFLFLPIRSGVGVAPLNTGFVYFHKSKSFPNHAGINVVWNFLRSAIYLNSLKYPEDLADPNQAQSKLKELIFKPDSTTLVLKEKQPNILLIILEGYTSKVIGSLGGRKDIAPLISEESEEGIIFENVYASGDRTDKGIISILSGYPAQPRTSIVKFPSKSQTLPNWPRIMKDLGYQTSFIYGGDPKFANIESFLFMSGFNQITQEKDFEAKIPRNKWGVQDGELFTQLLMELDTTRKPFFKVALTLSSHEPFDVPYGNMPNDASAQDLFLNSCRYTDQVTGSFLQSAKEKSWWNNTLIILTADHGHAYPGKREEMNKERFSIPLIWLGGALKDEFKGKRFTKMGSQTDIVNTLLSQVDKYQTTFAFSRDLLATETPSFAVFTYNNGYGFVSPRTHFIWDFDFKRYIGSKEMVDKDSEETGRFFMQVLFKDYNTR